MRYKNVDELRIAPNKLIMLFGMSGLAKTYISNLLRDEGGWFHYSVDYRIGTRYMGEHIADNFKREAMQVPLLRQLLLTDSVFIQSNITFENLAPLSTYLGKPGDPSKGGLPFDEYCRRQDQHRAAEIAAMQDTAHFVRRAQDLYGYGNFICDTSGSVCEVVDPDNPNDPVLSALKDTVLPVWIEGSEAHTQKLIRRFDRAPKPMCYQPAFLETAWTDYQTETGAAPDTIDPDAFVRWTYARALAHRRPRYRAIAEKWGVAISADAAASISSEADLTDVISAAIDRMP